jgi:hypothetical protein
MPNRPPFQTVIVDERQLRRLFNGTNYLERVQAGTLAIRMLRDGHPSAPKSREPFCTRSQYIAYLNEDNREVARVHQYLRPNGVLGASGRPDPKRVLVGTTLYILDSQAPHQRNPNRP